MPASEHKMGKYTIIENGMNTGRSWAHPILAAPPPDDPDQRPLGQYQEFTKYTTDLMTTLFSLIRIDDPDFALANDVKAIEKIRRDAVVQQLVLYRKHMVAGRKWHLEPGDETPEARELAKILEWLLKKTFDFTTARYRLADAVFLGLACEKMVGNVKEMKVPLSVSDRLGGARIPFWYIHRFKDIDKRRLRKEYMDTGPYRREYYWTIFNVHAHTWRRIPDINQYVMHTYNDEEDTYGFGRGLNEAIFYYWRGKAFVLKYAQQYAETFAKPWIYAGLADMKGRADQLSTRASSWLNLLKKTRGGNVVVGSKEDNVEFMQAPTAGQQVLMELIKYFDESLTRLIVGSILGVREGQPGLGSGREADVHQSTTEVYINYDRAILEETLTRWVVTALLEANYTIFENAGLTDCEPPQFKIDSQTQDPALEVLQQVQLAQSVGMRLSLQQVYERTGWKMPSDDEPVLGLVDAQGNPLSSTEAANSEEDDGFPDYSSLVDQAMDEDMPEEEMEDTGEGNTPKPAKAA